MSARDGVGPADRSALEELWEEFGTAEATADAVYATLRESVLSKALRPGQAIVEGELAQLFGVSRTPVREAILRLEGERLIERRGRKGVSVSEISPAEVLEVYDVRVALDALAAELSAGHMTPPQLAQLRWVNDRMRAAAEADDLMEMSQLNLEFHEWLARASGSNFLLQQVRTVHDRVRRFEGTTFGFDDRCKAALNEHDTIIEALEARDPQAAHDAARTHMLAAKQVRLRMIQESGLDPTIDR